MEALIFRELAAFYRMLHREQESSLKPSRPYRDYIAWLQQQDLKKAEAYWREMLKGYTESTPLGVDQGSEDLPDLKQIYDEQSCRLPESSTTALRLVAQQNHLTLNTMIQGAWALVLGGYSGKDDVVFGVTVAGRRADLEGVESMVGLFINTLPLRVRLSREESLLDCLKKLQVQLIEARQFEFSPLAKIQQWSEFPEISLCSSLS